MHEKDRKGLKDVNVITKFKQEIYEKGYELGTIGLLNIKKHFSKGEVTLEEM